MFWKNGKWSKAIVHMNDVLTIAKADGSLYVVMLCRWEVIKEEEKKRKRLASSSSYSMGLLYIPSNLIFEIRPPF
jgi:hypothetical protein